MGKDNPFHVQAKSKNIQMSGLLDREAYEWTKQDSTVLPIPAKTALIGLIIFFDSIIHPVFIRMLMCCLIHPLTATSIKEDIVVPTPKTQLWHTISLGNVQSLATWLATTRGIHALCGLLGFHWFSCTPRTHWIPRIPWNTCFPNHGFHGFLERSCIPWSA